MGAPWGALAGSSEAWIDTRSSGYEVRQLVSGLVPSTPYRWRVRLLYPPSNRLGQPASRWLYPGARGETEQRFRAGYPHVSFETPLYQVPEAAGTAVVTVTLDVPASLPATVDCATMPGSATAGEDYEAISSTLTFAPGEQTQAWQVPLLDDAHAEGDEQLSLTLSRAHNAVLGNVSLATLSLLDDDDRPGIHFEHAEYSAGEGTGQATLAVRLSTTFSVPVTVDYATQPGSAAEGLDYEPTSGTLTFVPGETRALLTVPLIDDAQREPDEWLDVVLRNAAHASLGEPNPARLWIIDDDPLRVWLPVVHKGP
jgi:hypothetical protein